MNKRTLKEVYWLFATNPSMRYKKWAVEKVLCIKDAEPYLEELIVRYMIEKLPSGAYIYRCKCGKSKRNNRMKCPLCKEDMLPNGICPSCFEKIGKRCRQLGKENKRKEGQKVLKK